MVFTTRLSGGKGGRNGFEHKLRRLGIIQKNGRPNHPQTQGKAERFQQTLKNWLAAQLPPTQVVGPGHSDVLRDHTGAPSRTRTCDLLLRRQKRPSLRNA